MGYFSDSLDFEKFFAKDLWQGIKKDPKRLVLGVDPASTWAWNKILGRDDKPLVDQMGGPYDGRVFSFGHGDGGVYDRAQAAGINTKSAQTNHDIAHLIAGSYALGGGFGSGGSGSSGGTGEITPANFFSKGTNPAEGIPGIAGPVGGQSGAGAGAGLGAMDYAKLGLNAAGALQPQGQQSQQPPPQAPVRTMAQPTPVPTFGQRLSGGLGRVGETLFPIDPNTGMTPDQQRAARTNALINMGLGMMAGSSRGQGFGASLGTGFGMAQSNLQGAMQQAYENAMKNRAELRAEKRDDREMQREDRLDARQQWLEDHTLKREEVQDQRYQSEQDFRLKQAEQEQKRWESEQTAQAQWRQDQLAAREAGTVPAGYRLKQDGTMEAIPGGPADPSGLAARKGAQALRKEFRGLQTVKDYEATLPLIESARTAPDTPQGDLQMIYTVGKILDPGSVVREGELQLTQNAAPWLQKMVGQARAQLGEGGRLTPEMRKGLIDMLDQRVAGYEQAYDRDRQQYSQYATDATLSPDLVVGSHPKSAYKRGAGLGQQAPSAKKTMGGKNYVQINGQWYEDDGTTAGQ